METKELEIKKLEEAIKLAGGEIEAWRKFFEEMVKRLERLKKHARIDR